MCSYGIVLVLCACSVRTEYWTYVEYIQINLDMDV